FSAGSAKSEISIPHGGAFGLAYSPDGKLVGAGGNNGTVWLWEPGKSEFRRILDGHTGRGPLGRFSPGGALPATSGHGMPVRVWDLAAVPPTAVLPSQPTSANRGVAFSPDGQILAVASNEGVVRLWDVTTGRVRAAMPGWRDPVAFSHDGKILAAGVD